MQPKLSWLRIGLSVVSIGMRESPSLDTYSGGCVYVCDYSWARPSPAAIKAAGFVAVCRYLSHDRTGKTLTRVEADSLHAAGLGIVLNFEDSVSRANGGFGAGQADATFANGLADSLGAPLDVPIYYSVDSDPGSPVRNVLMEYFLGAASVHRRPVGVYGGAGLVLAVRGYAPWGWVANAGSWNHGVNPEAIGAHLHQFYGHPAGIPLIPGESAYDVSKVLQANFGQWGGTQGDDLTPEQAAQLQAVHDLFFGGVGGGATHNVSMIHDIERIVLDVQAKVKALSASSGGADPAAIGAALAADIAKRLVA